MYTCAVLCCYWRCLTYSIGLTPGGLRYLRMGTLLAVAVLILDVQFERILSKSGGARWLVVGVRMVRSSCWRAGQFALVNCLRGRLVFEW